MRRWRRTRAFGLACAIVFGSALVLGGLPGRAWGDVELPNFATCMSAEMARYERAIKAVLATQTAEIAPSVFDVSGVEFCGTIGIVLCDRSDNPLGCQKFLAVQQDILRARVLDQLPAPDAQADPDAYASALYANTWALAHGTSAGQDCAGTEPVLETWCRVREANGRLRAAVLAWQVARYQGRAAPALEAGWVSPPTPVRPRLRPEALK
ncbi:MAG: hypothetical protein AAFW87_08895 [Pseudomonadota bacterium]